MLKIPTDGRMASELFTKRGELELGATEYKIHTVMSGEKTKQNKTIQKNKQKTG